MLMKTRQVAAFQKVLMNLLASLHGSWRSVMEMSAGQNQLSSTSQIRSTKNLSSNIFYKRNLFGRFSWWGSDALMNIGGTVGHKLGGKKAWKIYERCRLRTPEVRRGHYCGWEEGGRGEGGDSSGIGGCCQPMAASSPPPSPPQHPLPSTAMPQEQCFYQQN